MPVIHSVVRHAFLTFRFPSRAAVFTILLRFPAPAMAVFAATCAVGCVRSSTPSNVASGKEYAAGNAEYDRFFSELYGLQLALGRAPEKEHALRNSLSSATHSAPDSNADQIASALQQRSAELGKSGIDLKVTTLGVEKGSSPSAALVTSGAAPNTEDAAMISAILQPVKEAGALLGELREAKPTLAKLGTRASELERKVDESLRDKGRSKRAEVRQNLQDAEKLIPLMSARAEEVDRMVTELLLELEKATRAGPVAATPNVHEASAPKKARPGKKKDRPNATATPKATPQPHAQPKPAPAEKPTPAEKPKPAADDFEP